MIGYFWFYRYLAHIILSFADHRLIPAGPLCSADRSFLVKIILLHYHYHYHHHHHHHHHHHIFVLCGNDLAIATGSYCFALFLVIGEPLLIWKRLQGIRMFFWRIMEISHRQFRVGKIGPPFFAYSTRNFLRPLECVCLWKRYVETPKERRKWAFSLLPSPLSFFRPSTYTKGCYFYSPILRCCKIKDGGYNNTNINKLSCAQNMSALQVRCPSWPQTNGCFSVGKNLYRT